MNTVKAKMASQDIVKSTASTTREEGDPRVTLFILKALKLEGIDDIFLVPGAMIDSFACEYSKAGIRAIVAAQEGGAAYMADGYGRARQNFGVCMGIGGPGVTNMVTALSAA
jgi:acetolactate synthase-1/2/3 large subunit